MSAVAVAVAEYLDADVKYPLFMEGTLRSTVILQVRLLALLVFVGTSVAPNISVAQSGPSDSTYVNIISSRNNFGKVIHFFGDSIARGYGLGYFPDQATVEQKRQRVWRLRSISSILNQSLMRSGVRVSFEEDDSVSRGSLVAAYAGMTGQPEASASQQAAAIIRARIASGIIRAGDVILLEDAGEHHGSPSEYLENWIKVLSEFDGSVEIIMMTMFDFVAGKSYEKVASYDLKFKGRSHNDATRSAVEWGKSRGLRIMLVDLDKAISEKVAAGRTLIDLDGIHLTMEGQCEVAEEIAAALMLNLRVLQTCVEIARR